MDNDNALEHDLKGLIKSLAPGSRLPSVRDLMERHKVGPVTVQRVMDRLERQGYLVRRRGAGSFVVGGPRSGSTGDFDWQTMTLGDASPWLGTSEALLFAADEPDVVHLHSGHFDESLQPTALLRHKATQLARAPGAWNRVPMEGIDSLRSWFASEVSSSLGPEDVLITPGGQAALFGCLRAVAQAGDCVVVESPTYLGFIAAARSLGLNLVPVPSDGDGIHPDLLVEVLRSSKAKVVYLQPRHANPTGAVLALDRRTVVLDAVRSNGAFLIEDDWVRDLDLDERTPPALASQDSDGHVIYVRSLTKSVAPGLRIGAIVARGPVRARIRAVRGASDFFTSPLLQRTADAVVRSPSWHRHLSAVRTNLRGRRDVLLAALEQHLPEVRVPYRPRGGFHVWVRLPSHIDDFSLALSARMFGVTVIPARSWFVGDAPDSFLRLSYAGCNEDDLVEGVVRLKRAITSRAS